MCVREREGEREIGSDQAKKRGGRENGRERRGSERVCEGERRDRRNKKRESKGEREEGMAGESVGQRMRERSNGRPHDHMPAYRGPRC